MLRNKPTRKAGQDLRTLPTYTVPEAADYLAIDGWTLLDWYSKREPLLRPSGWYGKERSFALLSFRDLEEAYKLHLLRTKFGLSMQYLRKALIEARHESKSEHPLVDARLIVFDLLALEKPKRGKFSRKMIPLGVERQSPLYIPEVVDTWGKRIVADSRGKTTRIFPWRHAQSDDESRPVSIDPEVMSGTLVITGTRIPVRIVKNKFLAGASPEQIARNYGVSPELVTKALIHFDQKKPNTMRVVS